jgi:outer membrane lipoprotein-sorting protein
VAGALSGSRQIAIIPWRFSVKTPALSRRSLSIVIALLALAVPSDISLAGDWSLDDALRQIDKAAKGVRGLTGEASATDQRGEETRSLSGSVAIMMDGRMRIVLEDDPPRTILCASGKMFVHEPARSLVTEYKLGKNPDSLPQYALVGFSPLGTDLKKDYLVTLVEESDLDGHSVLMLELTPKSAALREAIQKIHLWIDQANWLPIQQRIFHTAAETHLTIRYDVLSRNDGLERKLFAPKWPKGTRKEKS